MSGPYWPKRESAAYLSCSEKTLWRNRHLIEHVRTDFGLRFSKAALDAYMAARTIKPPKARKADPDRILAGLGLGRRGSKGGAR